MKVQLNAQLIFKCSFDFVNTQMQQNSLFNDQILMMCFVYSSFNTF